MKTTAQINVHELVNERKNKANYVYVLVFNNKCLACSLLTMHDMAHRLTTTGGWPRDADVGPFIGTYDEFKDKHPEYFI